MKPQIRDVRFDFRGGRNSAVSPDLLNADELVDATNVRLGQTFGGFVKRSGTQRMHAAALEGAATIKGVTQWDGPSGKQIVVISNGRLNYSNTTSIPLAFTEVVPS